MYFSTAAAVALLSALASAASPPSDPNAPCAQQPFGYGPPSVPDTDTAYSSNPIYQYSSLIAPAPKGYVTAFRNLTGATQQSSYCGYYMLQTYNTTACAVQCNNNDDCNAFNIYYERDPLFVPADACPNPPSTVNIKCVFFQTNVSAATATNYGQYRNNFHVVVAGSDGFNAVGN